MSVKVVHVVLGKANPDRMNGVNVVAHNLLSSSVEQGLNVELCGITSSFYDIPENRAYNVFLFDHFRAFPCKNLIKYIRSHKESETIFHFHGPFIFQFFIISFFLKLNNIKWGVSVHGSFSPYALKVSKIRKKFYSLLTDWLFFKKSSYIHALTSNERLQIINRYPSNIVFVVPNGITIQDIPLVEENNSFLFLGRLAFQKGLDILIDGYHRYLEKGGQKDLLVVGDGIDLQKLKRIVSKKNIESKVKFMGAKYGQEKFDIISKSNCVVMPSRFEGFPIVALESFLMGKPLIASKESNIGEIIETNDLGLVLEKNNSEHLCEAMLSMDKEYIVNSNQIRGFILKNLTWDNVSASLYKKMVKKCI